jgi:iron complex outermembrane receptor protein
MRRGLVLLAAALWATLAGARVAQAQGQNEGVESITVTGDVVHLLDTGGNDAAFGLDKPLLETPRAVTLVSDTTIDRYGITGVNDLTAITPSAYTASYYGVEGQVSLRGTLAENYFQGFKRAENRGTYTTPLSDASGIEILSGPPSPIYGPGKVGGLVNFVPKTAAAGDSFGGEATLTYGSYSQRNATLQFNTPVAIGGLTGGVHAYGELNDSYSFYQGIHPSHQLVELTSALTLGAWAFNADYMYYHSNGDVQTPGWNRLTQALIDTSTYITGRNTSLQASNGKYLTFNDLGGNPYTFDPNYQPLACAGCQDAAHMLNTGVGTTTLSPRTIYIAKGVDFSNTITHTAFLEAADPLGEGQSLKLQLFGDVLQNDRFVSYGFPGSYRTQIVETRLRYDFSHDFGRLKTQTVAGLSWRYVHAIGKESFNSGVIALDRRDISQGPAPNDIFDSPFNVNPPGVIGLGWENNVQTSTGDAGAFLTSDIRWDDGLDLTVGGRYDDYNVRSADLGVLAYEPASGRGNAGRFTYSASLSYKTPFGLVPYVTNAKSDAVEIGQASQVLTSLLANRDWLSNSFLDEAGVKFTALDDHIQGALDWYVQNKTQLAQGGAGSAASVMYTVARGGELSLRYVVNANFSLTFAGSLQHTTVKGPDQEFEYVPARTYGISPVNGFGGSYIVYNFSTLPGKSGNYEDTLVPHAVISPYLTWTSDPRAWGVWGASFGGTYVGKTAQTVPGPIVFPSYTVLNASGFAQWGLWEADVNVNNLADVRYFTPDADTYDNLAALPGIGRTWKLTLKRLF